MGLAGSRVGASLGDHLGVDHIGQGGHQHIGAAHGGDQGAAIHRCVVGIEFGVEQFGHARLYRRHQPPGDDDAGLARNTARAGRGGVGVMRGVGHGPLWLGPGPNQVKANGLLFAMKS